MLQFKKSQILNMFLFIILFDLIFGGAGQLIMIGPISFRLLLIMLIFLLELILITKGKIAVGIQNGLLVFIFFYFTCNLLVSLVVNNSGYEIDSYAGYAVLYTSPFFIYYFRNCKNSFSFVTKCFKGLTFGLAIFSIVLWIYCFIGGFGIYTQISVYFLGRYNLGMLSFIGVIPRIFLKSSIFICVGFLFCLNDLFSTKIRKIEILKLIVHLISIITTFTTALYILTIAIALWFILHQAYKSKSAKYIIGGIGIFFLILFIFLQFDIFSIFEERFSGDYTMGYKIEQAMRLLQETLQSPVFGKGLGHIVKTDYTMGTSWAYNFEVMWGQLLMNTGVVGTALYIAHIICTIIFMNRLYKDTENCEYSCWTLGLILICLVSFTNPFMNNAIGLLYYGIVCGISSTYMVKK